MDKVDPELAADLGAGLECVKGNLINFVFASLILGLTCSRTTSHHTTLRGVITSLLHEGKTSWSNSLTFRILNAILSESGFIAEHFPIER